MFVSEFRYLVAFSHVGCSDLNDVENKAKFHTFDPPPRENYGRLGEISGSIIEALLTTEPPEYS